MQRGSRALAAALRGLSQHMSASAACRQQATARMAAGCWASAGLPSAPSFPVCPDMVMRDLYTTSLALAAAKRGSAAQPGCSSELGLDELDTHAVAEALADDPTSMLLAATGSPLGLALRHTRAAGAAGSASGPHGQPLHSPARPYQAAAAAADGAGAGATSGAAADEAKHMDLDAVERMVRGASSDTHGTTRESFESIARRLADANGEALRQRSRHSSIPTHSAAAAAAALPKRTQQAHTRHAHAAHACFAAAAPFAQLSTCGSAAHGQPPRPRQLRVHSKLMPPSACCVRRRPWQRERGGRCCV